MRGIGRVRRNWSRIRFPMVRIRFGFGWMLVKIFQVFEAILKFAKFMIKLTQVLGLLLVLFIRLLKGVLYALESVLEILYIVGRPRILKKSLLMGR